MVDAIIIGVLVGSLIGGTVACTSNNHKKRDYYTFGDPDALIEQWNASGSGTAEEGTE